jgi:hypothetical protein
VLVAVPAPGSLPVLLPEDHPIYLRTIPNTHRCSWRVIRELQPHPLRNRCRCDVLLVELSAVYASFMHDTSPSCKIVTVSCLLQRRITAVYSLQAGRSPGSERGPTIPRSFQPSLKVCAFAQIRGSAAWYGLLTVLDNHTVSQQLEFLNLVIQPY